MSKLTSPLQCLTSGQLPSGKHSDVWVFVPSGNRCPSRHVKMALCADWFNTAVAWSTRGGGIHLDAENCNESPFTSANGMYATRPGLWRFCDKKFICPNFSKTLCVSRDQIDESPSLTHMCLFFIKSIFSVVTWVVLLSLTYKYTNK